MIRKILSAAIAAFFTISALSAADSLFLKGKSGPGKGKHVVIVTGDEEYRSEESGPMLGKILFPKARI